MHTPRSVGQIDGPAEPLPWLLQPSTLFGEPDMPHTFDSEPKAYDELLTASKLRKWARKLNDPYFGALVDMVLAGDVDGGEIGDPETGCSIRLARERGKFRLTYLVWEPEEAPATDWGPPHPQ
jgi:hypothetical protein